MLHRYIKLVAACTVLLIAAGGMVTSTDSGLAVPDWPNTYGWFMFSFPYDKWVGGFLYEHGHRLIASTVGFLTIILAVWTWMAEPRKWVRWLGVTALGAVILQGLLGGITVLLLLPAPVSIGHAGLAQLFFCITVGLALFTSPAWKRSRDAVNDPMLRRVALVTTALVYCQILLGATMRHTEAGMAIPDFPLAFGRLLPPVWNAGVAIAFAHRLGALFVTFAILAAAGHVWFHHRTRPELTRPASLLVLLVAVQITLGAYVVWSGLQPVINTAHVVNGALVLATSLVLTLRSFRYRFGYDSVATPPRQQHARASDRVRTNAGPHEGRDLPAHPADTAAHL
jgi:cytochrome c oxidase assembly protein subunit 15